MQCNDVRARLQQANQVDNSTLVDVLSEPQIREHLTTCTDCKSLAEQFCLNQQLSKLSVPPASQNFTQRALDTAWAAKVAREKTANPPQWKHRGLKIATAACIIFAAGILFNQSWNATSPFTGNTIPVVHVADQEERQIDLLMVSGTAIPNANITVRLDQHVNLVGYPNDVKVLRWQAPISVGKNQLRLPIKHSTGSDGLIVVVVESEGASKQMQFAVSADNKGKTNVLTI